MGHYPPADTAVFSSPEILSGHESKRKSAAIIGGSAYQRSLVIYNNRGWGQLKIHLNQGGLQIESCKMKVEIHKLQYMLLYIYDINKQILIISYITFTSRGLK